MANTGKQTNDTTLIMDRSFRGRLAQFGERVVKDFKRNKLIYLMLLPVLIYYVLFQYGPMYGLQIAFKNYSPSLGFAGSPWAGFDHFKEFFLAASFFWRLLRNTILLSLYSLIFAFPAGIILALLLNEVKGRIFKRSVQTITYMPILFPSLLSSVFSMILQQGMGSLTIY